MSPKRLENAFSSAAFFVATACSESHRETAAPPVESHLTSPEDQCASCHPQHVEEWRSSAHAYAVRDPVFSAMVVHMISVGENTGALDAMLNKIADFYDDEVDAAVGALTSLLEPMMIVFLGVSVGGIVIAMYLPIFKMVTLIK